MRFWHLEFFFRQSQKLDIDHKVLLANAFDTGNLPGAVASSCARCLFMFRVLCGRRADAGCLPFAGQRGWMLERF